MLLGLHVSNLLLKQRVLPEHVKQDDEGRALAYLLDQLACEEHCLEVVNVVGTLDCLHDQGPKIDGVLKERGDEHKHHDDHVLAGGLSAQPFLGYVFDDRSEQTYRSAQ